jgi:6-pyruvoyltetrahydropterin/6-carboxytetrahydropterin synthase
VSGPVAETTGMVCNLIDLDGYVQREVLERLDIQNLNALPEFAQQVPTTENLCAAIYDILKRGFNYAHLEKVRIEETMLNSFEIGSLRN